MNIKTQILIVNGHLNAGGVERSLVDLLKHFDYDKYCVDLLLLEGIGDFANEIPNEVNIINRDTRSAFGPLLNVLIKNLKIKNWFAVKYRLILLLIQFSKKLAFKLSIKTLQVNNKYEIAIAYRTGFIANLVALGINASKKICWWHHGCIQSSKEVTQLLLFDNIVAVSNGVKQFLSNINPQLEPKIKVVPNIVDVDSVCHKGEIIPNPYNDFDGIKLVTVGRFSFEKHLENVVFTAARLKADNLFKFKWYIVGDGELYAQIEYLIIKYAVSDVVILCGRKTNPYPYIKHADIMAHTSHVESQGLVIQEAMALGVPCIVTRSIGPSEFIIDGENGIIVESTVDSLIQGIYRLVKNIKLQEDIIAEANSTISIKYSPQTIINQIESIL